MPQSSLWQPSPSSTGKILAASFVASFLLHLGFSQAHFPEPRPPEVEKRDKLVMVEAVKKQPTLKPKPKPPEPKKQVKEPPKSAPKKAFASRTIASTKTDTQSAATVSSNQIAGSRGNGIGTDAGLDPGGTDAKGDPEGTGGPAPVEEPPPPPPPPPPPAPAKPKGAVQPDYPEIAQQNGWEGRVIVRAHVTESGDVDDATVSKSSGHQELDDAAVAAVKRTKFEPGTRDGKPVATWVRVPVTFSLQ